MSSVGWAGPARPCSPGKPCDPFPDDLLETIPLASLLCTGSPRLLRSAVLMDLAPPFPFPPKDPDDISPPFSLLPRSIAARARALWVEDVRRRMGAGGGFWEEDEDPTVCEEALELLLVLLIDKEPGGKGGGSEAGQSQRIIPNDQRFISPAALIK